MLLGIMATNGLAQFVDPYAIYEERCAGCHEAHAGDFTSKNLMVRDGDLIGRTTLEEVGAFLASGHAQLTQEHAAALLKHFSAIATTGRLFQDKCRVCHDRAVSIARKNLTIKNGDLYGRYTGRIIREFLNEHGRLAGDEADRILSAFKRQIGPEIPAN